jgi:hypothetical protein
LENPTLAVLDRLAATLGVKVGELLAEPKRGERPPKPLPSGRRLKTGRRKPAARKSGE